jgi:hypothetical protein
MAAMRWLALLACSSGCFFEPGPPDVPPWQLVQAVGAHGVPFVFTPTLPSSLIVVAPQIMHLGDVTAVTDDRGNTYQSLPQARVTDDHFDGVDVYYTIATSPGVTRVSITGGFVNACAWEIAGIALDHPVDAAMILVSPGDAVAKSPAITTTRDDELVIAVGVSSGDLTGSIDATFTDDCSDAGNEWAHLTSSTAPAGTYTAQWTNTGQAYISNAVAFFTP